jgi:signal transduction histidine kinase
MHQQQLKQELKEQTLELAHQREIRAAEAEVTESVMKYISYELHDNVQHTLTLLRFQLELFMNKHPELKEDFITMEGSLDETTEQLRNLSRRINTDFITENSFISTVQLEVVKLKKLNKFMVHWSHDGKIPNISKEKMLTAFRIFQETINNVLKHSQAKNIHITLSGSEPWRLEVKDDGIGFDIDKLTLEGKVNGLRNMKNRAQMAGMSCSIESTPANGCSYVISQHTKEATIN